MKRNLFAAVITAGLLLSLTGCQLAKEESSSQDRLVGAFITTEYLDLMDMEAYLNDHLDEVTKGEEILVDGDTSAYQERVYGVNQSDDPEHPDYTFPGLEGIAIYYIPVDAGEESYWTSSTAEEAQLYTAFNLSNDMDEIVVTADLYVSADGGLHSFYANPIYQTAEGELYLISGTGISGEMSEDGTQMSQTLNETNTITRQGKTVQQRFEIKLNYNAVYPMDKTVLLQLDQNNQVIHRQELLPGQAPETLTPAEETAYILVESCRTDSQGETVIDREIVSRGEDSLYTYSLQPSGFFTKQATQVLWEEAESAQQ